MIFKNASRILKVMLSDKKIFLPTNCKVIFSKIHCWKYKIIGICQFNLPVNEFEVGVKSNLWCFRWSLFNCSACLGSDFQNYCRNLELTHCCHLYRFEFNRKHNIIFLYYYIFLLAHFRQSYYAKIFSLF